MSVHCPSAQLRLLGCLKIRCGQYGAVLQIKTKIVLWVGLSLLVLDQITKIWIVDNICLRGDETCQIETGDLDLAPHPKDENGVLTIVVRGEKVVAKGVHEGHNLRFEGNYTYDEDKDDDGSSFDLSLVQGPAGSTGYLNVSRYPAGKNRFGWTVNGAAISAEFSANKSFGERLYVDHDSPPGFHVIPDFLQIVHAQNPGAAFGMLADSEYRLYIFFLVSIFAVWVLWGLYKDLEPDDKMGAWIVGLIASGAFGNLIDRIHKQSVTDFIRVHWGPDSWLNFMGTEYPSFNVADMAIVGGVGLFGIHYLFFEDRGGDDEDADEEPSDEEVDHPEASASETLSEA